MHQHQAHLQQHLETVRDQPRLAVRKTLRAVAALKHEALALLSLRKLLLERQDFPGSHQGRQQIELALDAGQGFGIGVDRLLGGGKATPAGGIPACGNGNGLKWTVGRAHVEWIYQAVFHHLTGSNWVCEAKVKRVSTCTEARVQGTDGEEHEAKQRPLRHGKAKPCPVDLGALSGALQHLLEYIQVAGH